jgi:competence protein ComEA
MSRIRLVSAIATMAVLTAAPLALAQGSTSGAAPPASTPAKVTPVAPATHPMKTHGAYRHAAMPKIDLNSATREDLMKLPGVGEATADKIIAARPFKTKSELLSKNLVNKKEYSAIAMRVSAKQKQEASEAHK